MFGRTSIDLFKLLFAFMSPNLESEPTPRDFSDVIDRKFAIDFKGLWEVFEALESGLWDN